MNDAKNLLDELLEVHAPLLPQLKIKKVVY